MSREKVGHQFIGVPIFTVGQQEGFGIVRTNPSEQGYRRRYSPRETLTDPTGRTVDRPCERTFRCSRKRFP